MIAKLLVYLRQAYGWTDDVTVSAGPRGALGQVWRVDVGPTRYALKEIFADPPSEAVIEAELDFAVRAVEAGVRLPLSHPDRAGRYVVPAPGGNWLRLYDWVDLRPVEPTDPPTPAELGTLLARLHRDAPAATTEPGGEPPDPWYDHVPDADEWAAVAGSEAAWAAGLTECLPTLPELSAAVAPADPARLVVCHRDLHPENVLADPNGALVVVDWDNLGPADPGRELAGVLFDWFCDRATTNVDAVQATYQAYLAEAGPGRISELADFSMLIASRLNFLLRQAGVALDPEAEPRHREWAESEIDEALRLLPTADQLAGVLAALRQP